MQYKTKQKDRFNTLFPTSKTYFFSDKVKKDQNVNTN